MTLCPFSSVTRKRVSGSTSLTVPSISINASFATPILLPAQDLPAIGARDCGKPGVNAQAENTAFRDGESDGFQIDCGRLAVLPLLELIRDLLVLAQASESGAFDRRNVHEHVLGFVVGLNEAEPLGAVEELYGTGRHGIPP